MTSPPASAPRRLENPVQGDVATFLETSRESGGARTLLELEIAPGGRVGRHSHRTYAEHFRGREGRLTVEVSGVPRELGPWDEATVPPGTVHAWSNQTAERAVALVELRPGHAGFERTMRAVYGIAAEGRAFKDGTPRNPLHLALLLAWSETALAGPQRFLMGPMRLLAWVARRRGVDRELERRYGA